MKSIRTILFAIATIGLTIPAYASDLMQPIVPLTAGLSTFNVASGSGEILSITGSNGNRAAILQSDRNNRTVQAIFGTGNHLIAGINGRGNNVLQMSVGHNNSQNLGVTGQNNNVAFVQRGNNMNANLLVDNARNANVIAIQAHPNQLMPISISGLRNTTVIVGPGRMYVFPHR